MGCTVRGIRRYGANLAASSGSRSSLWKESQGLWQSVGICTTGYNHKEGADCFITMCRPPLACCWLIDQNGMVYITGSGCHVYKGSNNQRLMEKVPEVLEGNSENSRWICKSGVDNVGSGLYENVVTVRSTADWKSHSC